PSQNPYFHQVFGSRLLESGAGIHDVSYWLGAHERGYHETVLKANWSDCSELRGRSTRAARLPTDRPAALER
ncbi:MAG TPA: hypothetical protein VHI99_04170, partial [Vicinamibacterales bacterium]|nr:hypothetical protein [Vicinamibacterales bacterium]